MMNIEGKVTLDIKDYEVLKEAYDHREKLLNTFDLTINTLHAIYDNTERQLYDKYNARSDIRKLIEGIQKAQQ
jgi:hypothetical protein